MRVLINAASARRGGIVTYTRNLVSYMIDRGVDVHVAAPPEFSSDHQSMVIPVHAADYRPLSRVAWEQIFWRRQVIKTAPDILFSSANFGLLYSPVPQVLLVREGGLFDPLYLSHIAPAQGVNVQAVRHFRRRMMLMSVRHAQHVITPSKTMLDSLLKWAPNLSGKSSSNHYGARPDLFHRSPGDRRWREDGTLRMLYVSVYYPHKCPGVLCRTVDVLREAGIPAHSTITMTLEEIERTPGSAQDKIVLGRAHAAGDLSLGHRSYEALPELYANNDVFVFPSVSETFGHPMVEAMASGIPIVAADTAINREICGDGALYFRPFSATDLAATLRRLDSEPDTRRRIAEAGLRNVSAFTWEDHVERLIETFERVRGNFRKKGGNRS